VTVSGHTNIATDTVISSDSATTALNVKGGSGYARQYRGKNKCDYKDLFES
jgi:hypothetical protein